MMTDLTIRCAGHPSFDTLEVHALLSGCGEIANGIGVNGFVMDFNDLERVVAAGHAKRAAWKADKGVEFPQGIHQGNSPAKCYQVKGDGCCAIVLAADDACALLVANPRNETKFTTAEEIPFLYSNSEGARVLVELP